MLPVSQTKVSVTMPKSIVQPLEYYARPSLMTDPGEHAALFDDLPTDIPTLCQVVQGLVLHLFWAERYGETLSEQRKQEVNIRQAAHMLARIQEMDDHPLTAARPLGKRLIGNCRDFTVLLCAMLRHQEVPARARCGFGAYFKPGHYEDHWVCEYWDDAQARWVLVDAQLDEFQQNALKQPFDPLDTPRDQFIVGGQAWRMCREIRADPDNFGIFDMHGMWFIRGNLVRDTASLNKLEILPWDHWGLMSKEDKDLSIDDMAVLDHIAELTVAIGHDDTVFAELCALYENDARLHAPPDWPTE